MSARERCTVAALALLAVVAPYPMVRWRAEIAAVVGLSAVGLALLAVICGCVWLAHRWTVRPPMTEHLHDEAAVLTRGEKA